jgi:hypothetical protein
VHLNTFTEISKSFMATPDKDFIKERDERSGWWSPHRADAEFPEWHQVQIDPLQEKYFNEKGEQYNADVIHEKYGICDYKQFAKDGFKISENTENAINNNIVKNIIVWRWSNNNRWSPLEEGKSVGYDIMGIVDAKEALEKSYMFKNKNDEFERRCKLF